MAELYRWVTGQTEGQADAEIRAAQREHTRASMEAMRAAHESSRASQKAKYEIAALATRAEEVLRRVEGVVSIIEGKRDAD